MMKNTLDPIEEAIKLLDFTPSDEKLDIIIHNIMTTENSHTFSLEKEAKMLQRLYKVAHATLGAVLQDAIVEKNIAIEPLAVSTGIPENILKSLLTDSIYITNVPIKLFKTLICHLQLPFDTIQKAVEETMRSLQISLLTNESSLSPTFNRKSNSNPFELKGQIQSGKGLFESEEAVNLYLNRLEELLID
jgi:hypothetical protein